MWDNASAVAAHLQCSERKVISLARAKKIPAAKVGRSWRFSIEDIDEYLRTPVDPWKQSAQSRGRKRA